ncbi:MAG: DUF2621 family protein [Chloroflexi bacterium]|nr:MAG: DUF2621 family protein [Chloroflexota bacterium]
MEWTDEAGTLLDTLARMVPETLRELAKLSAKDEAESVASASGGEEVDVDDVMRAWIRTTPPEQRNGLVAVIESLGLEPERYAEDLESAQGWDEQQEYEEPPDSER